MGDAVVPRAPGEDSNPDSIKGEEIAPPEPMVVAGEAPLGTLHVHIHHAREIRNICIYHKQDVYAKICLTTDPQRSISTKTINGGGKNPLFDEDLRLDVHTIDCSLKCEVWMLSRVKNYLEDQLLGIAVVPLPEIMAKTGIFTHEFSLSSSDLFHSPAGFIQLTLSYVGTSPDVLVLPAPPSSAIADANLPNLESDHRSIRRELEQIEFPDPSVVEETQLMVSQIVGIPCDDSGGLKSAQHDCCLDSEAGVRLVESFSAVAESLETETSPTSGFSTIASPSGVDEPKIPKDDSLEGVDGETTEMGSSITPPPVIHINMEPEQTILQQDIVDMYMKSMQQFTESLAKMKLPMDMEISSTDLQNGDSGSQQNKVAPASRVFYGSRAFF